MGKFRSIAMDQQRAKQFRFQTSYWPQNQHKNRSAYLWQVFVLIISCRCGSGACEGRGAMVEVDVCNYDSKVRGFWLPRDNARAVSCPNLRSKIHQLFLVDNDTEQDDKKESPRLAISLKSSCSLVWRIGHNV